MIICVRIGRTLLKQDHVPEYLTTLYMPQIRLKMDGNSPPYWEKTSYFVVLVSYFVVLFMMRKTLLFGI